MNPLSESLLSDYIEQHSSAEPDYLQTIVRSTNQQVVNPHMLSGHIQGRLLAMWSQMIRPKHILEIGTYTGYSALCLAEGLAEGGKLLTVEKNDELEDRIRYNLSLSPLGKQVDLRIGNALDVVRELPEKEVFDLVFIDGDKREYVAYWEAIEPRLSGTSWVIADNTLWDGHICDSRYDHDAQTKGLRLFNDRIAQDQRLEKVIVPLRDGLTLIRFANPNRQAGGR